MGRLGTIFILVDQWETLVVPSVITLEQWDSSEQFFSIIQSSLPIINWYYAAMYSIFTRKSQVEIVANCHKKAELFDFV